MLEALIKIKASLREDSYQEISLEWGQLDLSFLIMENLERKLIKSVDKGNYVLKTELVNLVGDPDSHAIEMVSAYTHKGQYIGSAKDAAFLVDEKGIMPEISAPDHNVCSIGFCEKDKKWYGWSHRAICGFKIGDRIYEEEYGNDKTKFTKHGKKKIKDMKDAKLSAIRFADSVS